MSTSKMILLIFTIRWACFLQRLQVREVILWGTPTYAASGLNLTLFRAYDPNTARWLSRDPIGENGGSNLYDYVLNDPIDFNDPSGLILVVSGSQSFVNQTVSAIQAIASGPNGNSLVNNLINSPYTVTVQEDPNLPRDETNEDMVSTWLHNLITGGHGSNSTIIYDPCSKSDKDGNRPPFVGLAHEFGHAEAYANGTQSGDYSQMGPDGTTPLPEVNAVNRENQVRAEHNVPARVWH